MGALLSESCGRTVVYSATYSRNFFRNVKSQDDIKNYGAECVNSYKRVEQHIQFFLVLGVVYAFDHMLNDKGNSPVFECKNCDSSHAEGHRKCFPH